MLMMKLVEILSEINKEKELLDVFNQHYNNFDIPKNISKEEAFLIFKYTSSIISNQDLIKLNKIALKLPKYKGIVYTNQKGLEFKNNIFINHNILSTTTDESLFEDGDFHYSNSKSRKLYNIELKVGYSINNISLYGDQESEIWILPGAKLKLVNKDEDYIYLKQI